MEINDVAETGATFGSFYREIEDELSWSGHKVKTADGKTNDLAPIFEKHTKTIHLKQPMKPLMGCTRDAHFESEMGYTERDGAYGKVRVTWKFKEAEKAESEKESEDKMSKGTGEVNSSDKDDH